MNKKESHLMYNIRLANISGLDINNTQHSVAIDEAFIGVEDKEAFLQYCRDYKEGVLYATRTERIDVLATRYKKLQEQATIPMNQLEQFCEILSKKVEVARAFIKNQIQTNNNNKPFSTLYVDGIRYFRQEELKALSRLKISALTVIEMSEMGTLREELLNALIRTYIINKKEALTDEQKKIQQLTQKAVVK